MPTGPRAAREWLTPGVKTGRSVGEMKFCLLFLTGLLLTGCKLVDQTTFAPSPEASSKPAEPPKADPRTPLLTISFAEPNPDYKGLLSYAVHAAEVRDPTVQYDVIATLPAGGDADAGQRRAADVMRAIMGQGVPASRIHLALRSELDKASQQVRVYVR